MNICLTYQPVLSTLNSDNKPMKFLFSILFTFFPLIFLYSQTITVNGYVKDAVSGESLIGASVINLSSQKGCITNEYGFFSKKCQKGDTLQFSYLGYKSHLIYLLSDTIITVKLQTKLILNEITVLSDRSKNGVTSEIRVTNEQIKSTPTLLGEADVVKSLQFTPGVVQNKEGASGFSVRGGSNDQNLFMIDDVPVYNINHLMGFFSVFSADAVSNMTFYKSGMPARYGGRLSSVTDVRLKEGNDTKIKGIASVGLISSKFSIEGPMLDKKATFYISARRTYFDLLTKTISLINNNNIFSYYFNDFTLKTNYKLNDKNRLYLSFYGGNDKYIQTFSLKDEFTKTSTNYKMGWGNIISSIRWNYLLSKNVFSNATVYYSGFNYNNRNEYKRTDIESSKLLKKDLALYYSGVKDISAKWDVDIYRLSNHKIKTGIAFINHVFSPGVNKFSIKDKGIISTNLTDGVEFYTQEAAVYIEDDFKVFNLINLNVGLRYNSYFTQQKLFHSFQPRLSLEAKLSESINFIGSYNIQSQPIHLLTNSNIGTPSDLWLPVLPQLAPETSTQYSLGFNIELPLNHQFGVEAFYREMNNLIELKPELAVNYQTVDWANNVYTGRGIAKGLEFQVNATHKNLKYNVNYTFSKSERYFKELNYGKPFPFKYGSKHNISALVIVELNKNRSLSVSWVYNSGYYVSLSLDKFFYFENNEFKNNVKTPAFHHLDLSYSVKKQLKRGVREWNFGVYNAYCRTNPFYIYFAEDKKDKSQQKLYMQGLFPIVPSVSYTYNF